MSNQHHEEHPIVLLVEDDPGVMKDIRALIRGYGSKIQVLEARNAGEALKSLAPGSEQIRPNAIVLDLSLPYGDGAEELNPKSDPKCLDTGLRLLKKIREDESRYNQPPLWVSVITALSAYHVHHSVIQLLGQCGELYKKPFDTLVFEHDLVSILGVQSKVPRDLLPDHYQPPVKGSSNRS